MRRRRAAAAHQQVLWASSARRPGIDAPARGDFTHYHDAMPHLTLEYSGNLDGFDARATLVALNEALAASGHFDELDIKSRASCFDTFAVGTAHAPRAFAHAKLAILGGRSADVKRALSEQVLSVLAQCCRAPSGTHLQLCAEILEIERESYAKAAVEPR
ncbi:5-carboxymethyl-2-hydroxymuconate Delta-isomerase [Burkholderia stagnalis]|uniref:5-carboxymethyl-2-hydroxymuconate Delta-isomerase n=1 Tax=Burkholderia stagnalis TaxID=1503054 RepID=UPI000B198454|nr:5-carboxymethyl-2-hydroxymuconate Delta-isomerase [Burkholderia stagnalis]